MLELFAGVALIAGMLAASRASQQIDLLRFPLSWLGVLLVLDALARRRGFVLRALDWAACAVTSVLFWDLFELVDLRLKNWWYVGVSPSPIVSALFAAASFATVLPAVRLGIEIVHFRGPAASVSIPPRSLAGAGLLMLALALALPRIAFPFAWLFLWPLCEAGCALLSPRSLRSPLEGNWRAPLACALPLGLVWESLNWGCARGWIYTVPHFENWPRLFEMPLAGYLGYLPFLLEAGAALALVDRLLPHLRGRRAALLLLAIAALHVGADQLSRRQTDLTFSGPLVSR